MKEWLKRVGVGKGAEFAGMPRAAFMQEVGAHGVPAIDYDSSDLQDELREPVDLSDRRPPTLGIARTEIAAGEPDAVSS